MEHSTDRTLILRYLAGECEPDERTQLAEWIAADPGRQAYAASLTAIVRATGALASDAGVREAWQRMRDRLRAATPLSRSTVTQHSDVQTPPRPRVWREAPRGLPQRVGSRRTWPMAAVATVLMLAVGLGVAVRAVRHGAGMAPAGREYATAAGQRLSVSLVDGTRLTLAPASRVRVGRDREVDLEGEAYFAVVHDAAHPFTVRTRGIVTRDVGTAFDVRAYMGDPAVRVAVAEGAVCLETSRGGCKQALHVHDLGTVIDTAIAVSHDADIAALTGWTRGRLTFRDAPLREVAAELSRWYDLDVRVSDRVLAARQVTGTFASDSLAEGLSFLGLALEAQVERHGRVVTFTRRAK